MTTRKITLLAVFAFLLVVCIVQGITGAINPVKTIKTDAEPDAITISKDGKTVELTKNGFGWQVGSENYIANKSDVEKMIKSRGLETQKTTRNIIFQNHAQLL